MERNQIFHIQNNQNMCLCSFRILFFDYLYFIPIVAQKNNMKKLYSKLVLFVFTCFFISEVQAQTVVTIPPANAAQTIFKGDAIKAW